MAPGREKPESEAECGSGMTVVSVNHCALTRSKAVPMGRGPPRGPVSRDLAEPGERLASMAWKAFGLYSPLITARLSATLTGTSESGSVRRYSRFSKPCGAIRASARVVAGMAASSDVCTSLRKMKSGIPFMSVSTTY